jgi:RNA polymerase-binding protein DksA
VEQRQIDELCGRLVEKTRELNNAIQRDNEQLDQQLNRSDAGEAKLDFNHPADMVGGDPDYDKELNLLRRERAELGEVEQALQRIEKGSYGFCEECGEAIRFERLQAVPHTTHCLSCQEALDRKRH